MIQRKEKKIKKTTIFIEIMRVKGKKIEEEIKVNKYNMVILNNKILFNY
jgi:hypothetical protein